MAPCMTPPHQRITLRPVGHQDGIDAAGLLLPRHEFDDRIQMYSPALYFEENFFGALYSLTAGHTGAIYDLIRTTRLSRVHHL
jgi:hypothetical protein